jgi:branched-chain amino acid transport system permease protein
MTDLAKPEPRAAVTRTAPAVDAMALARRYGVWIVTALVLAMLPHVLTSGSALTMMSLMGIMIVFALSYNMLLGQTGMLSFGHAVYYGLGGFLAVHAMNLFARDAWPVPVVLVPLVGGLSGLAFGVIFGSVSTRRGGTAFAMISLGLGELVGSSSLILRSFFGGEEGINTNRTKLFRIFDLGFGPQIQVYYLIASWCLVAMIAMYALTRTPFGRMCNAVRDNPERAQFVGYNPQTVRFIAFCLSGLFAGIAGGLAAINFEIVNAGYVGAEQSGTVLLATYVGGVGNFIGPVLGAILVTYLQVMLSDVTEIWQLYFGLMFIAMVMFAPGGLAGLLMMHTPLWHARVVHRVLPAYLLALVPAVVALAGLSLVIEMAYRLLVKAPGESAMVFLGVPLDAARPLPWVVAAVALVGGFLAFRRTWPVIANAWSDAIVAARLRSGA